MSSISIRSAAGSWNAETPRTFTVGREPSCDIVADDGTVSRRHAEIRPADPSGDQWEVVDLGSSQGTWVDGRRVDSVVLTGISTVRFGQPGSGLELTITVVGAAPAAAHTAVVDRPGAPGGPALPPPGLDVTMLPNAGGGPGHGPGVGGPGLLVRLRTGDRQFGTGQPVRIGRDPSLEVHADNPSVSRLHAVVEPRPDGWWLVDRSTAGTFVEGERVSSRRLTEPVTVLLGHPTAGYELDLVPVVEAGVASAGIAKRKRRRTLAVVGAAAAVLVLVGGGVTAAVLLGGDDDEKESASDRDGAPAVDAEGASAGLSQESLDRAKAATVFIAAFDENDENISAGSGSIISEDGLILTNAHVADPGVPGMDGPADTAYLQIYTTTPGDDDAPVELAYVAETLVSDGYLDITVAQVTADAEGVPYTDGEDMGLPEPLPLGDSDALRTLDPITALGYPDLAQLGSEATGLPTLTVTAGTVSSFNASEIIGSDRAEIDADIRIGSGNSGGPSINDAGEIIGLNTRVVTEATSEQEDGTQSGGYFTGGSGRIVPVNLGEAVLQIAREGGDSDYVSPYLGDVPDPTQQMAEATVTAHGWALDGSTADPCSATSPPDDPIILSVAPGENVNAQFSQNGLAPGTQVAVDLYYATPDPDAPPELADTLPYTIVEGDDDICLNFPFVAPENTYGINAVFRVGEEDVVENPLLFQ